MQIDHGPTRRFGTSLRARSATGAAAFALLLLSGAAPAFAQRPDIVWMTGGIPELYSAAYSPDGLWLASGGLTAGNSRGEIKLWRASDGGRCSER